MHHRWRAAFWFRRETVVAVAVILFTSACGSSKRSGVDLLTTVRLDGMKNGVLMIPSERLLDRELAELLEDARVVNLRELSLHNNALTAESARLIARLPKLRGIEVLDLSFNPVGDDGVDALAQSDLLQSVRILSLASVGGSGRAARVLASSPHAANIAELDLRYQQIGTDAALLIGKRSTLRLAKTGIDGPTAVALLRAAEVQTLDLSENALGTLAGLETISGAISHLKLESCELTNVAALADAPAPSLETLELDYNPLGDAGLALLTQAPWFKRLKFLSLMGTKASPSARQALARAWGPRPGLTIESDQPDESARRASSPPPRFPNLNRFVRRMWTGLTGGTADRPIDPRTITVEGTARLKFQQAVAKAYSADPEQITVRREDIGIPSSEFSSRSLSEIFAFRADFKDRELTVYGCNTAAPGDPAFAKHPDGIANLMRAANVFDEQRALAARELALLVMWLHQSFEGPVDLGAATLERNENGAVLSYIARSPGSELARKVTANVGPDYSTSITTEDVPANTAF